MAVSCFSHQMDLHLQSGDQGKGQRSEVKCQTDQNHILVRSKASKNVCSVFSLMYKFKMTKQGYSGVDALFWPRKKVILTVFKIN